MDEPRRLRFALGDEDLEYTRVIDRLLRAGGHEVVGVATTAADVVALLEAARPDVLIMDPSMDFSSDFDVLASVVATGARLIVFSQQVPEGVLVEHGLHPTVVYKPDVGALEQAVRELDLEEERGAASTDRRTREAREAVGPEPVGLDDAQAFYAALGEAVAGDALVSVEVDAGSPGGAAAAAAEVRHLLRTTDRLLAAPGAIRVYLPGGGTEAVGSFRHRLVQRGVLPGSTSVRVVVLDDGENPADAFTRLKGTDPEPLGG